MAIQKIFEGDNFHWFDVEAPLQEDLDHLSKTFGIDELLLEDTTDPTHLPKFEESGRVKFFLTRENTTEERKSLNTIGDVSTKLGIFLLEDTMITIHRLHTPTIPKVKKLIKKEGLKSADEVALALALEILDTFDQESKRLTAQLDKMENEIFTKNPDSSKQIRKLYKAKRRASLNARVLNASSEWMVNFRKLNITKGQYTDLRDKYKDVVTDFDHLNAQVTNLISMFLALTDQKANQVMKVLAIYSAYFLPLTFIAGVYGMNFDFMPELHLKYGYFYALGLMLLIVIVTNIYLRRKKF